MWDLLSDDYIITIVFRELICKFMLNPYFTPLPGINNKIGFLNIFYLRFWENDWKIWEFELFYCIAIPGLRYSEIYADKAIRISY